MKIRTGLIEATRRANPAERDYAKWAEERGLWVACEPGFDEEGNEVPTLSLGIEEEIEGKVHAFFISPVRGVEWPEEREHDEAVLRVGFDRYKARLTEEYRDAAERIARAFGLEPDEVHDHEFERASDEAHALRVVFMDALFDHAQEIADKLTADWLAERRS